VPWFAPLLLLLLSISLITCVPVLVPAAWSLLVVFALLDCGGVLSCGGWVVLSGVVVLGVVVFGVVVLSGVVAPGVVVVLGMVLLGAVVVPGVVAPGVVSGVVAVPGVVLGVAAPGVESGVVAVPGVVLGVVDVSGAGVAAPGVPVWGALWGVAAPGVVLVWGVDEVVPAWPVLPAAEPVWPISGVVFAAIWVVESVLAEALGPLPAAPQWSETLLTVETWNVFPELAPVEELVPAAPPVVEPVVLVEALPVWSEGLLPVLELDEDPLDIPVTCTCSPTCERSWSVLPDRL
jgi:hypothetical protein